MTARATSGDGPVVLKLGGSAITAKDRPETVDEAALERASSTIATALDEERVADLVLVHGGGSFGHHHASRRDVDTETGTHDATDVRAVHGAMTTLNAVVCSALRERSVSAVPVQPLSLCRRDGSGTLELPVEPVSTMLGEGFVPVLHGDLVAHEGAGATVVSGDELVVELGRTVGAERVGLCSTVPGVLDSDGAVIDRIEAVDEVAAVLEGSDDTDVTGGMATKVRALAGLDVEASIFGLESLASFLAGRPVGTRVASG